MLVLHFLLSENSMLRLSDDIKCIKGIGDKTAELFHKMDIFTVEDLLLNLPKGFICYEEPVCPQAENNGNIIEYITSNNSCQ